MSQHYPEVKVNNFHIDILTAHFVRDQIFWWVGNNLFGDIPSDLGPACTGTLAIAPSASLNPEHSSDLGGVATTREMGGVIADLI